jgi:hypothetical protein
MYEVVPRSGHVATDNEADALHAAVVSAATGIASTVFDHEDKPLWSTSPDTQMDDSEPYYPVTVAFRGQSLDPPRDSSPQATATLRPTLLEA